MITDLLKVRKSAGVPVSPKVHAILKDANAARAAHDHRQAADLYRKALDRDPSLAHVWVQYGHMLRKCDDHGTAEDAYHEALRLNPAASDPHLHLGHLYKEQGQMGRAARSYLIAAQQDSTNADALMELHASMDGTPEITPEAIMTITRIEADPALGVDDPVASAALRARSALDQLVATLRQEGEHGRLPLIETMGTFIEQFDSEAQPSHNKPSDQPDGPAIIFDVSDLISYFTNARLPTGIQRVQIEAIGNALRNSKHIVKVCAFLEAREDWVAIPAPAFQLLCRLSLASGDREAPEWVGTLTKLRLQMLMAEPMAFPQGAFLVNLGTSWWLQNYFLRVRQAKAAYGIHYVPFVHDFIPIMASEHCTRELTQDFITWVMGAFDHADHFFVNSEATKRDLITVAATLGHSVDPANIIVVRLDADFRKPIATPLTSSHLGQWGIGRTDFVLFVSTVESRKNHLGAFDAWISLIRQHGVRRVPKLVCVGNKGWLNDAIYARLAAHEGLRDRVIMLSGLSDAELDLLYRSCLFTLYPSHYEGWGLPVTESLCYGKVPLTSDASSLPEAGGPFAHYFEAGSTPRLTAALEQLIFQPDARAVLERKINDTFSPRTWRDIAMQIATGVEQWARATADAGEGLPRVPLATLGAYHPIVRNFETRIWSGMRSAEVFRTGSGWWGPDNWGCWTKAQGGTLDIGLPVDLAGPMRLYIQLHGLPSADCHWTVSIENGPRQEGSIRQGDFKWIWFDVQKAPDAQSISLTIEGSSTVDLRTVTEGSDPRIVAVGVAGFFLCTASDLEARSAFLEAVALGNLSDLAFNRELSS